MPHAAIAAGCVDFVMTPERIATELARIARHPYVIQARRVEASEVPLKEEEQQNKIFILLRRHSGVDFTYYKQTTIQRRIKRRMVLHKLDKLSDYVRYLQENPAEVDALYHDMLINVTSFFRDPEVFAALAEKVFPAIVKQRSGDAPIRIWVPGCSTGEEAYSIAICLLEYLGDAAANIPLRIFATDIDDTAIERARNGIYAESIAQDVSPERLRRFFAKLEGGYQIAKHIRDVCLFAKQNVIKDPPFSKLDLVSCRNLLIYLGPVLQKKVLAMFHYALKPTGFLLLGTAETIGEYADLFRLADAKQKLYLKKSIATPLHFDFVTPAFPGLVPAAADEKVALAPWTTLDVQKEVDRLIMKRFSPPGVVVNERLEILQFRGHTGAYLEPAPGEASLSLLKMAREGLLPDMQSALAKVIKEDVTVRKEGLRVSQDGQFRQVDVEVMPVREPKGSGRCFLVLFEETAGSPGEKPVAKKTKGAVSETEELRQELAATKEYLQSVIEQQETTNEELRSANEEIQSSNEELQSINEELETAQEELQSVNEELATVNDELESRNSELSRANNDLNNLIASVNIPIVIVGADLRIRRYTPLAEKSLNIIPSDVGRPIGDIKPNISALDLKAVITEVIDKVAAREFEGQDGDGRWYSVRVRPYKTLDNQIDGAVIAFIDIDQIKRSYEAAKDARDYAEAIVAAVKHPLLVLDEDLRVVSASAAYNEVFQVSPKETLGNLLSHLGNGQWAIPKLRAKLEEALRKDISFDCFVIEHDFEGIGRKAVYVSGRHIPPGINRQPLVLMQIEEVTDQPGT